MGKFCLDAGENCFSKYFGNKCSILAVLTLLTALVALWFVWFGAPSLISREIVEQNLQRLSADLSELAAEHGKEAKLTYSSVEIEGWGYNKKAVVLNPVVEISSVGGEWKKGSKFSAATDKMIVEADPVNPNRVALLASGTIGIDEDGVRKTVGFSEPIRYYYTIAQIDGKKQEQQDIVIPKQIVIATVSEAKNCVDGDAGCAVKQQEEIAKEQTAIGFLNNPTVRIVSSADFGNRFLSYDLSSMEITSGDGSKANFGSIIGSLDKGNADGEGKTISKYNLAVSDLVFSNAGNVSKPYDMKLDMAMVDDKVPAVEDVKPEGDKAEAAKTVEPDSETYNSEVYKKSIANRPNKKVTINQFSVSRQDFSLNAAGEINIENSDPLPYGLVKLNVEHLPQFMTSEMVPAEMRGVVEGVLVKMTGKPLAGQDNLAIDFKREKNGVFYLGQTTFEALAATFLSDILMNKGTLDIEDSAPAAAASGSERQKEPEVSVPTTSVAAPVYTAPAASPVAPAPAEAAPVAASPATEAPVTASPAPAVAPNAAGDK